MRLYKTSILLLFSLVFSHVMSQQLLDESWSIEIKTPSFVIGTGLHVCIDEYHYNGHTASGNYLPFANLLRSDGYNVKPYVLEFSVPYLTGCDILIVANAKSESNVDDWSFPHPSAFSKPEIQAVVNWIQSGGNLFLIADHAPMAGAAADLGAVLGILMADVVTTGNDSGTDIFRRSNQSLSSHPITDGGILEERIESVRTFTGQAARISEEWQSILTFGPSSTALIEVPDMNLDMRNEQLPRFSTSGWTQGATRDFGGGKVVFLGEAAACTAQLVGPDEIPIGMNSPYARFNAQFCLNAVRWLSGLLDN